MLVLPLGVHPSAEVPAREQGGSRPVGRVDQPNGPRSRRLQFGPRGVGDEVRTCHGGLFPRQSFAVPQQFQELHRLQHVPGAATGDPAALDGRFLASAGGHHDCISRNEMLAQLGIHDGEFLATGIQFEDGALESELHVGLRQPFE